MSDNTGRILRDQVDYYRARAPEYDEWLLRTGRYDRGDEHRALWRRELATLEQSLREATLTGDVLELASGTGWWTRHLAGPRARIVALDTSPEAHAISRERMAGANVAYVTGDIFALPVRGRFDAIVFAFWLSHVPDDRFQEFWRIVGERLKPDGRVLFFDSMLEQSSTAIDHHPVDESGIVQRRLNDGREFQIVKRFYTPALLEERLAVLGWRGWVRSSGTFFLYGLMTRAG